MTRLRGPVILSICLFVATSALGARYQAKATSVSEFFRVFGAEWLRNDPNQATRTRYLTGTEQESLERQMTPRTLAWRQDRIARARRGLVQLRALDRSTFNETERVSADVMEWQLQSIVDEEPYLDFAYPLDQYQGGNVALPEALTANHPLRNEKDGENYLSRLKQMSARMGEAVFESRRLEAKGILPPRFILDATIAQMERFVDSAAAQNPLVTTLDEKLATTPTSPSRRAALRVEAEQVVSTQIYPAWRNAIGVLNAQTVKATSDAGLWRFKEGADVYRFFLRRNTTTNLTVDQIHDIGLKRVAELEGQIDALLRQIGRTTGSVKSRIDQLSLDRQYANPTSEESRDQIMRDIDRILRDAQQRAIPLFDRRPTSAVVAQPVPRFREADAAATSSPPAADGSRPGLILFPRRIEWMTTLGLRSVIYHEGVPGHFFAGGLQVENRNLPSFRQLQLFGGIPAFGEGWALYAERLAAESGWYDGDLEGLIGQLNWELFRARRLVVDTGLHSKHWTRQRAIDYGIEASEVDRYVANPGQACAYMIGELKILEARDKAKSVLGERFSLKQFHNVVLETGTVPLEILERQIDAYVHSVGDK